jgi:hypothetical protein
MTRAFQIAYVDLDTLPQLLCHSTRLSGPPSAADARSPNCD